MSYCKDVFIFSSVSYDFPIHLHEISGKMEVFRPNHKNNAGCSSSKNPKTVTSPTPLASQVMMSVQ